MTMNVRGLMLAVVAALGCANALAADKYPSRPVRVVVPFAPGGGSDAVGRVLGAQLAERMGQSFVVDNRPAASGIVGTDIVSKAAPDGYTILVAFSTHAWSAKLFAKLPFDPIKDFEAVTLVTTSPLILVTHPSVPGRSAKEFIAYARANPGKLNYGSSGPGSAPHLITELFNSMAGVKMTHIVYKGIGPVLAAQLANEIQVCFSNVLVGMPHVRSGKLIALGSSAKKRSQAAPDVPPLDEAGVPGFDASVWWGILAPPRTPRPIVERLRTETIAALGSADVKRLLVSQGMDITSSTPQEFLAYMRSEMDKWGDIGRKLGVQMN